MSFMTNHAFILIEMVIGIGNVIEIPNNHVTAKFTDELSDHDTVLNCTVQQGGIRTDTVWNVVGYPDATKFHIFGDGHQPSSKLDYIYGNKMNISAELMSELDRVNVSCGSHENPHQAIFEFHIKGISYRSLYLACYHRNAIFPVVRRHP